MTHLKTRTAVIAAAVIAALFLAVLATRGLRPVAEGERRSRLVWREAGEDDLFRDAR